MGTRDGVGAEILGDDERECQLAVSHLVFRVLGILQIHVAETLRRAQFGHHLFAYVELLLVVGQSLIQIDQADLEGSGVIACIPDAGQIDERVHRG